MCKSKSAPGGRFPKKTAASLVRSSAAEYLTFVAAGGAGDVQAVYADEIVWLSQKTMGLLYDVDVRTISYHLQNVFADHELEENSVIQSFRITATDGKSYDTQHLKKVFADQELTEDSVIRNFRITAADGKSYDTQHYNLSPSSKVGLSSIASSRTGCSSRTLTGCSKSSRKKGPSHDQPR